MMKEIEKSICEVVGKEMKKAVTLLSRKYGFPSEEAMQYLMEEKKGRPEKVRETTVGDDEDAAFLKLVEKSESSKVEYKKLEKKGKPSSVTVVTSVVESEKVPASKEEQDKKIAEVMQAQLERMKSMPVKEPKVTKEPKKKASSPVVESVKVAEPVKVVEPVKVTVSKEEQDKKMAEVMQAQLERMKTMPVKEPKKKASAVPQVVSAPVVEAVKVVEPVKVVEAVKVVEPVTVSKEEQDKKMAEVMQAQIERMKTLSVKEPKKKVTKSKDQLVAPPVVEKAVAVEKAVVVEKAVAVEKAVVVEKVVEKVVEMPVVEEVEEEASMESHLEMLASRMKTHTHKGVEYLESDEGLLYEKDGKKIGELVGQVFADKRVVLLNQEAEEELCTESEDDDDTVEMGSDEE